MIGLMVDLLTSFWCMASTLLVLFVVGNILGIGNGIYEKIMLHCFCTRDMILGI